MARPKRTDNTDMIDERTKNIINQYEDADDAQSSIPIKQFAKETEGLKPRSRRADLKFSNAQSDQDVKKFVDFYARERGTIHKGKTYIDPKEIPAGYVAMNVCESIKGRFDTGNLRELEFTHGWIYATPEQMPQRAYYNAKGEIDDAAGRVHNGQGLVIMIRRKEIHDAQLKNIERESNINNKIKKRIRSGDTDLNQFMKREDDFSNEFFPSTPESLAFSNSFS